MHINNRMLLSETLDEMKYMFISNKVKMTKKKIYKKEKLRMTTSKKKRLKKGTIMKKKSKKQKVLVVSLTVFVLHLVNGKMG